MPIAGTPRKLQIDGVAYDVVGDADFQEGPLIDKEYIPNTGKPIIKRLVKESKVEGVKIVCSVDERDALDTIISDGPVDVSYTEANGSVRKSGSVDVQRGNRSTADGTVELTLVALDPWETF